MQTIQDREMAGNKFNADKMGMADKIYKIEVTILTYQL